MENTRQNVRLDLNEFPEEGLYLIFPDGERIEFVRKNIDPLAEKYWADSAKIPLEVKQQADFLPCDHCPHHGEHVLCHALKPLLPYLESVDRYMSYDKVTAVFRGENSGVLHVCPTTMQHALKYLALLSMMYYCEMGDRYRVYFTGVIPLMDSDEVCARIYANIYLHNAGDEEKIASVISRLQEEVLESSICLVKRLNMICRKDAFVNAFINTNAIVESLNFKKFPAPAALARVQARQEDAGRGV